MKKVLILFLCMLCPGLTIGQIASGKKDELCSRAADALAQSRYTDAIALFSECLTASPETTDAYLGRAQAREQVRDYQGALTDYSIFLEFHPDSYDALLARANARFRVAQYEHALNDYQKLLTLSPGETNMVMFRRSASTTGKRQITTAQSDLKATLYNYLGLTEFKLGHYPKAMVWFDSAILREPDEPDYYVNRGMVAEKTNPEKAIADYEHALRLNPDHTQALNNLGVVKAKSGHDSDYFDRAIESDSSMLAPYLERAYQRMQGGFFKGALEDYNSAISIETNDPEIFLNRGFVKERLGDHKGAYADYTQALRLDESFPKAWLNRGNVLARMNRHQEAVEDYTTALTFDPEYGAAFYNRAIAREKLKQRTEACADLAKARQFGVDVDPKLSASVCK